MCKKEKISVYSLYAYNVDKESQKEYPRKNKSYYLKGRNQATGIGKLFTV